MKSFKIDISHDPHFHSLLPLFFWLFIWFLSDFAEIVQHTHVDPEIAVWAVWDGSMGAATSRSKGPILHSEKNTQWALHAERESKQLSLAYLRVHQCTEMSSQRDASRGNSDARQQGLMTVIYSHPCCIYKKVLSKKLTKTHFSKVAYKDN